METSRIEEVVGDFVALKRRGVNLIGLCPFHNEKTPSFNVSPVRGIFKCFGCGQAGNSVRFIMELEKLSYPEAIRYLAKKYHIEVIEEETGEEQKKEIQEKESMYLVNLWAASYFQEQLWETEAGQSEALSYFRERGFSDETIRKFQLGFHPDGWSVMTEAAIKAGYNPEFLEKTGLSIRKEDGKHTDRFRGRVMFPIQNLSGKIIGFGGRILNKEKKTAKYLNSPESEVYHKSQVLYGIYHSRKAIVTQDECLLVEGYTDVISLHQAGIENVVSSSGTSLTQDQIRIIRRYTENVTILFDGDPAGIKASFRGIDMLLEQGLKVKVVSFPEGEDPDSFARGNSPLYVKDYIRTEATDFITFKTRILREEVKGDPIKTAAMIHEIIDSLALVSDGILRSLYLRECSIILGMEEQTLLNELNKVIRKKRQKEDSTPLPPPADLPPDLFAGDLLPEAEAENIPVTSISSSAQEDDVIRILVKHGNKLLHFRELLDDGSTEEVEFSVGDFIISEISRDGVVPEKPGNRKIYDLFAGTEKGLPFPDELKLVHHEDEEVAKTAIHLTSEAYTLSEHWSERHGIFVTSEDELLRKSVFEAVYTYKLRRVMRMLEELQRMLPDMDENEQDAALVQMINLENAKRAFASQLSYVILKA